MLGMPIITDYAVSGYVSETRTSSGVTTNTVTPLMPRGSTPIPSTPYWLLADGQMVKPVVNNRADVRAMKNGK